MITVIIPSFNTGKTIARAIESVIETGYPALEVIIVDDGSTDDSIETINRYVGAHEWIHLYTHKDSKNHGIAVTRNVALQKARGAYVAFLDADDTFLPNRFDKAAPLLDANESINVVYEPYELVHVSGKRSEAMIADESPSLPVFDTDQGLFEYVLVHGGFPHTSSVTIRSEAIKRVGGFPPLKYCLEKPLWLKLYSLGGVRSGGNEPVSRYYLHEESTCAINEDKAAFRFEDVKALIDVYKWMKRTDSPYPLKRLVESRMMGKYMHYTTYVRKLNNDLLRDVLAAPIALIGARPETILYPKFWYATVRMFWGKTGVAEESN
ncbi:glycosyltransferase [Pseudomonadota bacterium]